MYVVSLVMGDNNETITKFVGKNPDHVFPETKRGEKDALLHLVNVAYGAASMGQILMIDSQAAAQKFIRFFVFDSPAAMMQGAVCAVLQLKSGKPTAEELEPIKAINADGPVEEIPTVKLDRSQVRSDKIMVVRDPSKDFMN
jgi:hypothetical protein